VTTDAQQATLRAEGLTKRFGGVVAVSALDLAVRRGHVHGIIGPNGAGKTTLFNLLSGFVAPDAGRLWLEGQEITRSPIHQRARLGMVRTFQNLRLFRGLTVLENVLVGQHTQARLGPRALWPAPSPAEHALRREADDLLALFHLTAERDRRAGDLPYGAQKRVEMARALAARPSVLLLDEPTAGMDEQASADVVAALLAVRERGVTVVLVEHDMDVVMHACDVISVLNFGVKIAEGTPTAVRHDPDVQLAYLGQDAGAA
jgi:branched-chain amino acid transport system ATP-binding protein